MPRLSPSPAGREARGEGLDEPILERLVALNSQRAEEERNGYAQHGSDRHGLSLGQTSRFRPTQVS